MENWFIMVFNYVSTYNLILIRYFHFLIELRESVKWSTKAVILPCSLVSAMPLSRQMLGFLLPEPIDYKGIRWFTLPIKSKAWEERYHAKLLKSTFKMACCQSIDIEDPWNGPDGHYFIEHANGAFPKVMRQMWHFEKCEKLKSFERPFYWV